MNIIIWLAVGAAVGWVASMLMQSPEGLLMNIVVGIAGAVIGGWMLGPLVGAGTINSGDFSLTGLAVSLLGAVALLALVKLIRRSR
jgi:uncharacterized membrane protein YeaQ/YmgE (transglycosylase-associated protein family)